MEANESLSRGVLRGWRKTLVALWLASIIFLI